MMKEKLEAIFERLQSLDIKATKDNMEKLLQTLYDLQDIYRRITEAMEGGAGDESGQTADPEG